MSSFREVRIAPRSPDALFNLIGPARVERLRAAGDLLAERLAGRTVWNVSLDESTTAVGELVRSLLGYIEGFGIGSQWLVVQPDPELRQIARQVREGLQGLDGSQTRLGRGEHARFEQTLAAANDELAERVQTGDLVLLHDPGPAGLAPPRCRPWRHRRLAMPCGRGRGERSGRAVLGFPAALSRGRARDRVVAARVRAAMGRARAHGGDCSVDRSARAEEPATRCRNGSGRLDVGRAARGERAARATVCAQRRDRGRAALPPPADHTRRAGAAGCAPRRASHALGPPEGHGRGARRLRPPRRSGRASPPRRPRPEHRRRRPRRQPGVRTVRTSPSGAARDRNVVAYISRGSRPTPTTAPRS